MDRRALLALLTASVVASVSRMATAKALPAPRPASQAPTNAEGGGDAKGDTMSASNFKNLNEVGPESQVRSIRCVHDGYKVATADGQVVKLQEGSLRFKCDSSAMGPPKGKPVIMPAGMKGDRATIFFSSPLEIAAFIT